jgi:hypothetical protein
MWCPSTGGTMRFNDFIRYLNENYPIQSDQDLAVAVAVAMHNADNSSGDNTFVYNGQMHIINAVWIDGCINGDCNPATCWTHWTLA